MASELPILPQQPHFQTRSPTAVRRLSPPPRNKQNEICCTHAECQGKNVTFRRLCEWNKHMDRHERPYKCEHPNCQNALGFTYSGGLMRHQREVHGLHQTTKSRLFCPFPDCVRNASGEGFSRKENLEEHKRRRHPDSKLPEAESVDHGPQHKKRKRIITPLPSDNSVEPESTDAEYNDDSSIVAPALQPLDDSPVVKRLKQELQRTREELHRMANENNMLRAQVTQYYDLVQTFQPQIYNVHNGAQPAHGLMAQPSGYTGVTNLGYPNLHSAYKK